MALELKEHEPLPDGLRRIFVELFDSALSEVDSPKPSQRTQAVHESRKRLKELRATLRLLRPALGDKWFGDENSRLRDLGQPLSAVRDAQVMVDALAKLKDHFKPELAKNAFAPLRKILERRRLDTVHHTLEQQDTLRDSAQGLAAAKARLDDWPLDDANWDCIITGITRVYRQGRSAMSVALDSCEDLAFHEWRKRAKDLRYQLTILHPIWPATIEALRAEAHELGDQLGDDHDLAVLADLIDTDLHDSIPKPDRQALLALVARRRQTLQKHAKQLGARLYAEKPKHFHRRMQAYAEALS